MEDLMRGGPAATLEDILEPGDTVAEEIVEDIRDSLPPTTNRANLMQSGEPSDHRLDPPCRSHEADIHHLRAARRPVVLLRALLRGRRRER